MNAIAEISLVLFVTMAINGLKLHELLNLALPLMIILAGQTILMVVFAWVMFFIFGKTYDAVMLCAGGIGFSMGSTANGLANMQAIAEKYGSSPRAWLIISLVGAFLIDLINNFAGHVDGRLVEKRLVFSQLRSLLTKVTGPNCN